MITMEYTEGYHTHHLHDAVRYKMTDIPVLPVDVIVEIMKGVNYDGIVELIDKDPRLIYLWSDRSFWLDVAGSLVISNNEVRWINTLDVDSLIQLVVKWQSFNGDLSVESYKYLPLSRWSYRSSLKGVSTIIFDPVGACKALGELGDPEVFDIIDEYPEVTLECAEAAIEGVILSGTDRLLDRLLGYVKPHNYQRWIRMAIMKDNYPTFKMLSDRSSDDYYTPLAIIRGWDVDAGDKWMLIDIANDDVDAMYDSNIEHLTDRDQMFIQSTEMIDALLDIGVIPLDIWLSLIGTLNGTPERLALLKYLEYKPSHDDVTQSEYMPLLYEHDIPEVTKQIIEYVSSSKMSVRDKIIVLVKTHAIDLDSVKSLVVNMSDARLCIIGILTSGASRRESRRYTDIITHLGPIAKYTDIAIGDVQGVDIIDIRIIESIEMLESICYITGQSLDDVCSRLLKHISVVDEMHSRMRLDLVSYYFHIRGYSSEMWLKEIYELADDDIDVCISMVDHIYIKSVSMRDQSSHRQYILLELAIYNEELPEDATVTDLFH